MFATESDHQTDGSHWQSDFNQFVKVVNQLWKAIASCADNI